MLSKAIVLPKIVQVWAGKWLEVYIEFNDALYMISLNAIEESRNKVGMSDFDIADILVDFISLDRYSDKIHCDTCTSLCHKGFCDSDATFTVVKVQKKRIL